MYITNPTFQPGTWLCLNYVWRINTNIEAQNQGHAHSLHLHIKSVLKISPYLSRNKMHQNLTSIHCMYRITFGPILKNTQHEIFMYV